MADTLTQYTQLWTLTKRDGTGALRRALHSSDVYYGGNLYTRAALSPSTVDEKASLAASQIEIGVVLSDLSLVEADLISTRWNRARLRIDVVDLNNLAAAAVKTWKGIISRANVTNGSLSRCEFISVGSLLQQQIGAVCQPSCRVAEYGNAKCGKNVTAETFTTTVTAVTDNAIFTIGNTQADDFFQYGTLRFNNGNNSGLKKEIKSNVGDDLVMVEDFPFEVEVGDSVTVVRGCNREFATCVARGNAINFDGEPSIPGIQKVLKSFPE